MYRCMYIHVLMYLVYVIITCSSKVSDVHLYWLHCMCSLSYTFPPTGARVLGQSYMHVYMYLVYIRGCVIYFVGYMYYTLYIVCGLFPTLSLQLAREFWGSHLPASQKKFVPSLVEGVYLTVQKTK